MRLSDADQLGVSHPAAVGFLTRHIPGGGPHSTARPRLPRPAGRFRHDVQKTAAPPVLRPLPPSGTTMSGKHQPSTPTVKFPHRSRRGVLLGLTVPQLVVAGLTGLLLLAVILARGVVGALQLIPLWAVIALLVFVRHRGRALADWAPIVVRYVLRRMRGQLVWLTRPSRPSRPARVCSTFPAPLQACAWPPLPTASTARSTTPTPAR